MPVTAELTKLAGICLVGGIMMLSSPSMDSGIIITSQAWNNFVESFTGIQNHI
jgi:hypothetical protein